MRLDSRALAMIDLYEALDGLGRGANGEWIKLRRQIASCLMLWATEKGTGAIEAVLEERSRRRTARATPFSRLREQQVRRAPSAASAPDQNNGTTGVSVSRWKEQLLGRHRNIESGWSPSPRPSSGQVRKGGPCERCPVCSGTGWLDAGRKQPCTDCAGTGVWDARKPEPLFSAALPLPPLPVVENDELRQENADAGFQGDLL